MDGDLPASVDQKLYGKIAIMALLDLARVDTRLTPMNVVMLQAFGSLVDQRTIGFRTQTAIAKEMGVSHTAVGKHERRLIDAGYLTKHRASPGRYRNKFEYHFNLPLVDKWRDKLVDYREMTEVLKRSETAKGFGGAKPDGVALSETSKGFTRKEMETNMKAKPLTQFKSLGSVTLQKIKGCFQGRK